MRDDRNNLPVLTVYDTVNITASHKVPGNCRCTYAHTRMCVYTHVYKGVVVVLYIKKK